MHTSHLELENNMVKLSFVYSVILEILGKYLLVIDHNSRWKRGIEGRKTVNVIVQAVIERKPKQLS